MLRQAALAPDVFEALFRTFHGDEVTLAKLKQRAAELKVHPEETERCAKLYIETLEVAGLVTTNGELIQHVANQQVQDAQTLTEQEVRDDFEISEQSARETPQEDEQENAIEGRDTGPRPQAVFNVNINLDSSLDTEKLERQLKILKNYGAI